MPSLMKQGQSPATIYKERRIAAALSVGMRIASSRFANKGYRFWHYDGNCGTGHNTVVGIPGSPVVFWDAAENYLTGLRPAAFFCDIDLDAMRQLQQRLNSNSYAAENSFLLPGDNQAALEVFAGCIETHENPKFAIGSLLIDPNGWFYRNAQGIGVPTAALQWFCREFLRIDTIVNINVRAFGLQRKQGHSVLPARAVLASLNKSHWLVSRTIIGTSRFLLAIGRNKPTEEHRALQLYDSTSEMGRFILDWAERERQGEIEDVSFLSRISSSPGVSRGSRHCNASVASLQMRCEGN